MPEAPSLYRRHRPRTFADVMGQEPIVRTLRNAVEQDKVHHAYLFVGSRGTGKTSMAKILAACLNCERGPTTEPCGACDSCLAIAGATSLDVIEMDAASNNSVDDIRDLREKVAFAPVSGRHKVYILDEAHMLSPQAWNAFLKTLEEPPPNTVFVLCTTEASKVLPTVVDRCHRFDFARPSAEQVSEVLRRVAAAEGIDLPDPARALLARKATGSFRDALGNLEQLVTYSGPQVALDDVLAVLGVADAELLFECADAVGAGDPARALRGVARLAESGRDPGQFFEDLEDHARGLLVVQALGELPAELRMTTEQDERLAAQAQTIGRATVVRLLDLLAEGREARKAGADARLSLELALVKAAAPDLDPAQRALLARIERLESALAGGERTAPPVQSPPAAPAPRQPNPGPSAEASAGDASAEPVVPVGAAPAPVGAGVAAAVAVAAEPEPEPQKAPVAEEAPALDLDAFRNLWPAVLATVREQNAMLAALLEGANPVEVAAGELRLAFAESAAFLKRKAEGVPNRETLGQAIKSVTGRPLKLVYELRADAETEQAAQEAPSEEELVAQFMSEFDAQELPPEDEPTQEA
ncbi:MAG: polymerase subunit gamma/tau [Solirubrobacteraceae bacterium]|nr:polymerase subunit gamma/tau [Solirubrobacteraceae bacterium]